MKINYKQIGLAALTFVIYTALLNWKAALVLMVGIGWHEHGHLFMARRMGMATKSFYYIPLVGGVAFIAGRYRTYAKQAAVALAGPAAGTILAFMCYGVYLVTGNIFWAQVAMWQAILNSFNLLPLSFLDAGQVLNTITFSINEKLGVWTLIVSNIVAVFVLFFFNPLIALLVGFYGGKMAWGEFKAWNLKRLGKSNLVDPQYMWRPLALSKMQMAKTIGAYFALLGLLGWLMNQLNFPEASVMRLIAG